MLEREWILDVLRRISVLGSRDLHAIADHARVCGKRTNFFPMATG